MVVLDHLQHDKGGADRVKDRLQREHGEPAGSNHLGRERPHGQWHQEDRRVQAWHHDRGGARLERFAPLSRQLECDEERIDRDD
jgi:hypothetical protein